MEKRCSRPLGGGGGGFLVDPAAHVIVAVFRNYGSVTLSAHQDKPVLGVPTVKLGPIVGEVAIQVVNRAIGSDRTVLIEGVGGVGDGSEVVGEASSVTDVIEEVAAVFGVGAVVGIHHFTFVIVFPGFGGGSGVGRVGGAAAASGC